MIVDRYYNIYFKILNGMLPIRIRPLIGNGTSFEINFTVSGNCEPHIAVAQWSDIILF